MSFGFMPGNIPVGCEVEARVNSVIIGDTIVNTINASGYEIDWGHPDTQIAMANNLQVTMQRTGMLEHGAEIIIR